MKQMKMKILNYIYIYKSNNIIIQIIICTDYLLTTFSVFHYVMHLT